MTTFKSLNLLPEIQQTLDELGFTTPTEIQKTAIPLLLSTQHIDFHGQAQTGTGNTLAFGIPLLQRIVTTERVPQALIVAPTRELAVQIYESIARIGQKLPIKIAVIYGGVSFEEQKRTLQQGVQIVVGTPGRLLDHVRQRTISLSHIKTLVLDEADIMLEMGFKEDIDEILKQLPKKREIWLFSATVKPGIHEIISSHMKDTVSIRITPKTTEAHKTKQYFCIVPLKYRLHAVTRFIQSAPHFYGIIFCRTKMLVDELAAQLAKHGYDVEALHGDMSQAHRNRVIKKFKQQGFPILVATDVAARGIDIANLTHVINYSIPEDLESYVHRIGRTGRAGKEGIAITFISNNEQRIIRHIERQFHLKIEPIDVPSSQELIATRVQEVQSYLTSLPEKLEGPYANIAQLVSDLSPKQLVNAAAQLLYAKFFSTLDLEDISYTHVDTTSDQLQEISITAGSQDNVTKDMVFNYLARAGVTREQVRTVRIIKHRTFVKLAAVCTPELLTALRRTGLDNKKVHVSLTCLVPGAPHEQRRPHPRRHRPR
jgi:ATP-dependent RNA helicase DeaD